MGVVNENDLLVLLESPLTYDSSHEQMCNLEKYPQVFDLADHLVSVGLVNIGAEGDLPLLAGLRYGGNSEHLAS